MVENELELLLKTSPTHATQITQLPVNVINGFLADRLQFGRYCERQGPNGRSCLIIFNIQIITV